MSRIGKTFGLLTIIEELGGKRGAEKVKCRCICGNEIVILYRKLIVNSINSCGCTSYEEAKKLGIKNKHKKRRVDIIGERFGNLLVIEEVEERNGKRMLRCLCDCGEETIVEFGNLRNHLTLSCGCKRGKQNGKSTTRLYKIWSGMRSRCYRETCGSYYNYGGRGITICEEWKENFSAFEEWAKVNGYADNLTIERIDVNGNYCPENCTWVTWQEQCNNKRNNIKLTYKGQTHNLRTWAEITQIPLKVLRDRACLRHKGWSDERILTEPIRNLARKGNKEV